MFIFAGFNSPSIIFSALNSMIQADPSAVITTIILSVVETSTTFEAKWLIW